MIGNMSSLNSLYLYNNALTGAIPIELGNLQGIRKLELDNNRLNGTIPPQLGNLTSLSVIRLNYNNLTGTIPSELGVFILIISYNIVTFLLFIPGKCTQLEKFNVLGNRLKKSIPESFSKLLVAEDYEDI